MFSKAHTQDETIYCLGFCTSGLLLVCLGPLCRSGFLRAETDSCISYGFQFEI